MMSRRAWWRMGLFLVCAPLAAVIPFLVLQELVIKARAGESSWGVSGLVYLMIVLGFGVLFLYFVSTLAIAMTHQLLKRVPRQGFHVALVFLLAALMWGLATFPSLKDPANWSPEPLLWLVSFALLPTLARASAIPLCETVAITMRPRSPRHR